MKRIVNREYLLTRDEVRDAIYEWLRAKDIPVPDSSDLLAMTDERKTIERLIGSLRYIEAQARANHPGALQVILANATAALSDEHDNVRNALGRQPLHDDHHPRCDCGHLFEICSHPNCDQ